LGTVGRKAKWEPFWTFLKSITTARNSGVCLYSQLLRRAEGQDDYSNTQVQDQLR
jgi:hypothetical protein